MSEIAWCKNCGLAIVKAYDTWYTVSGSRELAAGGGRTAIKLSDGREMWSSSCPGSVEFLKDNLFYYKFPQRSHVPTFTQTKEDLTSLLVLAAME